MPSFSVTSVKQLNWTSAAGHWVFYFSFLFTNPQYQQAARKRECEFRAVICTIALCLSCNGSLKLNLNWSLLLYYGSVVHWSHQLHWNWVKFVNNAACNDRRNLDLISEVIGRIIWGYRETIIHKQYNFTLMEIRPKHKTSSLVHFVPLYSWWVLFLLSMDTRKKNGFRKGKQIRI